MLLTAASSQEETSEFPHIQEVQLVDLAARRAAHTDRQIQMSVYSFAITTDLSLSLSVIWTHFLCHPFCGSLACFARSPFHLLPFSCFKQPSLNGPSAMR